MFVAKCYIFTSFYCVLIVKFLCIMFVYFEIDLCLVIIYIMLFVMLCVCIIDTVGCLYIIALYHIHCFIINWFSYFYAQTVFV